MLIEHNIYCNHKITVLGLLLRAGRFVVHKETTEHYINEEFVSKTGVLNRVLAPGDSIRFYIRGPEQYQFNVVAFDLKEAKAKAAKLLNNAIQEIQDLGLFISYSDNSGFVSVICEDDIFVDFKELR